MYRKSHCATPGFGVGVGVGEDKMLKTHFSAYMRRVAFIITSNKHTLSLFLTSKDSLIYVIMSVIKPLYCTASTCMKIKGLFMTPADSLSQITIFQLMVIRVLCNQKCVFKSCKFSFYVKGKALSGEISCTLSGLVIIVIILLLIFFSL